MYQTRAQFQNLQKTLGAQLEVTAGQFLNFRGIPFETSNLDQMSICPKDLASEFLMFGGDIWPDDSVASAPLPSRSWIRPLIWTLGSLLVTLPIGYILLQMTGFGLFAAFLTGIVVVASVFGTQYGLLLSGATSLVNNLLMVPPVLTFTVPTKMEIFYAILYATMAILIPMLARRRFQLSRLALSI